MPSGVPGSLVGELFSRGQEEVPKVLDPVRAALRVSYLSIVVGIASGAASTVVGLRAASLALVGSGATVLIDVSSSVVLVWRFRVGHRHPRAESWAHLVASVALLALAGVLAWTATHRLVVGTSPGPTRASGAVAAFTVLVLPPLARAKYRAAARVQSAALRADAHITSVGALTALLSLVGVVGSALGTARADSVAALLVAVVAGVTGAVELRGR